jgi:uncharacterized coiled-coil DUF342 family protein
LVCSAIPKNIRHLTALFSLCTRAMLHCPRMEEKTKGIHDALEFIKDRTATKTDVTELRVELNEFRTDAERNARELHNELSEIAKRLDGIEQDYANLKSVTKKIDEIRNWLTDIERHLGLTKKIAA